MSAVGTGWHMDYSTEINSTLGSGTACRGRQQTVRGRSSWKSVVSTRLENSIENSRPSIVHTTAIR